MKVNHLPLFILALLIMSCGGGKSAVKDKELKAETFRAIVKNYDKSKPQFETMRGRLKGVFIDGEDQQSINISYRFKKDEILWMSAKLAGLIQLAKMKVTPENIQFYERIDQSYFDGDFKLISSFLGIELNYQQLQNLLLGQAIKPFNIDNSDLENVAGYFQINSVFDKGVRQSVLIDENNFKIQQQTLSMNERKLTIIYKSYQVVDNMSFPEEMLILADDNEKVISINLSYKNINLNGELRFPFSIPNNFKPIKLN